MQRWFHLASLRLAQTWRPALTSLAVSPHAALIGALRSAELGLPTASSPEWQDTSIDKRKSTSLLSEVQFILSGLTSTRSPATELEWEWQADEPRQAYGHAVCPIDIIPLFAPFVNRC